MSPDKGRRGSSGKGEVGSGRGPAAVRRLGLMVFGAVFVVLFAIVALTEGVGSPSVPSGDVALVEETPGDIGEISQARFDHALELTAAQNGEKKPPAPGDAKYEEVKETALKSLFEAIWLQGLANEWGIEVSDKEVDAEFKKVKKESFKTDAEFQKFLDESGYTPADLDERVRIQILSTQLQEELKEKAPTPTQSEVEDYYEAAKATQFTQKPSRDVRLIVNKDEAKAEAARDALSSDNSEKNWENVAKKYSEDATTKNSGGLQKGVQEGTLEEPLDEAVFKATEGEVEGPLKAQRGYTVFEVINSVSESVQDLSAVESQIKSTLAQRAEQEYFAGFVGTFNVQWRDRTFCAPDYITPDCGNFDVGGHPSTAPAGCYEEGVQPDACPAPVFQLIPAMPGTITPLEPKGKPLAQRPRPLDEPGAGGEEGGAGLPGGALPPGEVPTE